MAHMQSLSIRLPDDDFQWLLSQDSTGGKTPSEILRALLARSRQQEAGLANSEMCATWMRGLIQPFVDSITALERKQKSHSDVVSAVSEWVPHIMAVLVSSRLSASDSQSEAVEIEAVLAQQSFRFLIALLRAVVTSTPATYDKEALDRYLPDIIELVEIISTRKAKEHKNV